MDNKKSTSLKYQQIEEELKQLILEEKIKPGEKMPSENVLTAKYGVSRQTVRKQFDVLISNRQVDAVKQMITVSGICFDRIRKALP